MYTPIFDFVSHYSDSDSLRCHMPGHKGKNCGYPFLSPLFSLDITEIFGADSLFHADGIIAQSEAAASSLFHCAYSCFSTSGSTLGIQTMLALMKLDNRSIIAARNVHRAFINAAALLGLDVFWLFPSASSNLLSADFSTNDAEKLLLLHPNSCIYITSPDYTGKIADIPAFAKLCHKYNAPLIVDNAHGAHLAFFQPSLHPINLGADLCCDSAHKMLPALTGSAYVHTSQKHFAPLIKQNMSLFASTSPSYLSLISLDLCNDYLAFHICDDINHCIPLITQLKDDLSDSLIFADSEPFHITICAALSGFNGLAFAQSLRKLSVECEYADDDIVILLMSPICSDNDFFTLRSALRFTVNTLPHVKPSSQKFSVPVLKTAMSIRDATFSTYETVNVENSVGRICASVDVPCPPAVPIAVSGEIISQESVFIFKKYGINSVNVVK